MSTPDFIVPFCTEEPVILYSDNDLIIVDKPAGLLSVPGRHPANRDCLISRLQRRWPTALMVHRLDMDTSGIMVVALNGPTQSALGRQFQNREVKKAYQAIVHGLMEQDQGMIDLPLIADWPNRPRQKVCYDHGKPAVTRYRVTDRDNANLLTSVELFPETGRSHQLRVHMASIGHPILGDKFYGEESFDQKAIRLMLHASALAFTHPATGKPLEQASAANLLASLSVATSLLPEADPSRGF